MENAPLATWQIALIVGASVAVAGPVIGMIIGKVMANKKNNPQGPLLSKKERVLYLVSIVLGAALITTGLLLPKKVAIPPNVSESFQVSFDKDGENAGNKTNGDAEEAQGDNATTNAQADG